MLNHPIATIMGLAGRSCNRSCTAVSAALKGGIRRDPPANKSPQTKSEDIRSAGRATLPDTKHPFPGLGQSVGIPGIVFRLAPLAHSLHSRKRQYP
jgi:hypothetical protein